MSSENVVRSVAGMKHEWCSACTRRRCRDIVGDAMLLGRDSCASSIADSYVMHSQKPSVVEVQFL